MCERLRGVLESAAEAETVLEELAQEEESTLSSHADAQIYFQGGLTRPLNLIPYVIAIFTALKIYVAPLLALCLPIILCVMPYVLLTGLMNMPIPWETYKHILFQYILGINPAEPWTLKQVLKLVWGLASFGQGILQPIMTSYHSAKLRDGYMRYAEAIATYTKCVDECASAFASEAGARMPRLPVIPADPYVRVEWWRREKTVGEHYRGLLGYYDLMCALGSDRRWRPIQFNNGECWGLQVRDFYDISLAEEKAVRSSMLFSPHSLFTGPNRGGKSSALRAILQAVLCAQSFGATWGASLKMAVPFRRLYTRLVATDVPGCKSLFESDVAFALDVLRTSGRGPSLILIDELFHSTNPRDAEASAAYFLRNLWSMNSLQISIISTHMFNLVEQAQARKDIDLLCVPASPRQDGMLEYSYSVNRGVCMESSVEEVWKSFFEKKAC